MCDKKWDCVFFDKQIDKCLSKNKYDCFRAKKRQDVTEFTGIMYHRSGRRILVYNLLDENKVPVRVKALF